VILKIKNLKRIMYLHRQTGLIESVSTFFNYWFNKERFIKSINFSQLCVFIHQGDQKLQCEKIKDKNILAFNSNQKRFHIQLRRRTSDFFIFNQIFIRKDYFNLIEKIKESINFDKVRFILDAGANIGASAIYFHSFFPNAKVICIEPESSNFSLLKTNILLNNVENIVKPFQMALWNKNEMLSLKNDFRDRSHHSFNVSSDLNESLIKIEGNTVKYFMDINDVKIIDLLKIDIEGAEKYIFEDFNYLSSFLPITRFIAIEIHEEIVEKKAILEILDNFGFECLESGEYYIGKNKKMIL